MAQWRRGADSNLESHLYLHFKGKQANDCDTFLQGTTAATRTTATIALGRLQHVSTLSTTRVEIGIGVHWTHGVGVSIDCPLFTLLARHFQPVPGHPLAQQPLEPLVLVQIVLALGDGEPVRFGHGIEHTPHPGQGVTFGRLQGVLRCSWRRRFAYPPLLAAMLIALPLPLVQMVLQVTFEQHLIDEALKGWTEATGILKRHLGAEG
uniref:Uncharacterized protein n=1 Tax=Anopheles coluzzii TaxID=1518534 RepID=A0A8W7PI59_ANOCL